MYENDDQTNTRNVKGVELYSIIELLILKIKHFHLVKKKIVKTISY